MRPYYETDQTLAEERATADFLEKKFGGRLVKMPIKLSLDFMVLKDGVGTAFVEVRNRKNEMRAYSTYMVSLFKVMAASNLTQTTGLPAFLAVQWTDAVGIVKLPPSSGMHVGYGGLTTRNDPQDMEPIGFINISEFKILK